MQFRILGPLEVDAGNGPIPLGGPKQRAVLANLVVRASEVVPADTLIEELWGAEAGGGSRNTLQTYVSNLRRVLGDGILVGRTPGYILNVAPDEIDATRFDALVREARNVLPIDPDRAIDRLDRALSMWRGPALADVAEGSLFAEAARLEELRVEAQEERIDALLASGSPARAIGELEPLLAQHPLRERLWGLLMLALYRDGRQADALDAFGRAREILADELGIDPSPDLVELHRRILAQDPSLMETGEPLRGYRLLEKLSETRNGIRFRAVQPRTGRDVELEIFDEHVAGSQAFVESFERDAELVAALEHPNVVPIFDYWREPGRAYVVWRFPRGRPLPDEVSGELDARARIRVVEQLASALAAAHRQGFAHGAVGGDAVTIDAEGNAYLGRFVIGAAPRPAIEDDLRDLAALAGSVLGPHAAPQLSALLGADEAVTADAFVDAVRRAAPGGPQPLDADLDLRNPYRGLRPFREVDAPDFFGRSAFVRSVVGRITAPGGRFVAVVGPSGCGKSSLVRAGVVPALRGGALGEGSLLVAEMSPGARPFEELEAAITRVAVRTVPQLGAVLRRNPRGLLDALARAVPDDAEVVLVVDQFEELFTLTTADHERAAILAAIHVACADPDSRLRVIATIRADLYDRPLAHPRFGELLAASTIAVPPLSADELEQAIDGPAGRCGVRPESGLVAQMIADAVNEPGALPSVQFALTELFDRREGDRMTLASYRKIGGIVGALSRRADELVGAAGDREGPTIRQLFLRLVSLDEGRPDTRRRAIRAELDALGPDPSTIDAILDTFGRHRILTFDREALTHEPTVEIAHEALLVAWPTLRDWIDEAREQLRQERSLARVADEWLRAGRDASFLLRGARLAQAVEWAASTDLVVPRDVRELIDAGVAEREAERRAEAAQREREARTERRATRRLRALVAVFAGAALVAGSLTIAAKDASRRAEREAAMSATQSLATDAVATLDRDPDLAVLLAIAAVERSRAQTGAVPTEVQEALHTVVTASRLRARIVGVGGVVAAAPGGGFVARLTEQPGTVAILDAAGRIRDSFSAHEGGVTDLSYARGGPSLVTAGEDGWVRAWDRPGILRWEMHRPGPASTVSISSDGTVVAGVWPRDGRVVLLRAADGRAIGRTSTIEGEADPVISPDGTQIAVPLGTRHGFAMGRVLDLDAPGRRVTFRATPRWAGFEQLSWSPDGAYVAGGPFVWDARSGKLQHVANEHAEDVLATAWSPDGTRAVTASLDGTAKVWQVDRTGFRPLLTLASTDRPLTDVAFSEDGDTVFTASDSVRVWDVRTLGDAEVANLPVGSMFRAGLTFLRGDGGLSIRSDAGTMRWDLGAAGSPAVTRTQPGYGVASDVNRTDGRVLWAADDGTIRTGSETHVDGLRLRGTLAAWAGDDVALVVAGTGRSVALVGPDGTERWRVRTPVRAAWLDAAGDTIAVGSTGEADRYVVRIIDAADGTVVTTFEASGRPLALDPTGERVLTEGFAVWDAATGRLVEAIPHEPGDLDAAFNGRTLAVLARDRSIRVYDLEEDRAPLTLPALHVSSLGSCLAGAVAVSDDGSQVASQGCDGVRVWALNVDDLLAIARERVTRNLTPAECRRYLRDGSCPSA